MINRVKLSLLSTVSLGMLALPATSQAATQASPPSVVSYGDNGVSCLVTVAFQARGTIDDTGNGEDQVDFVMFHTGATSTFTQVSQVENIPIGQTETHNFEFRINPGSAFHSPTNSLRFQIRDRSSTGPSFLTPDTTITRADLLAAGGLCAQIANNQAPTANAGADATVAPNTTITASGTANDPDGDPLTIQWTQISGPNVTLSNPNSLTPSFTSPIQINQARDIVLQLSVSDGSAPVTDTVTFTVPAGPNTPPVVDAGADQSVPGGVQVTLNGTSTDVDGDPLTHFWQQTGGPSVTIIGPLTLNPTFTAPAPTGANQVLTFVLRSNDGTITASDTVEVTVLANTPPTVDAGADQIVAGGSSVTLTGTANDIDGDALTYQWTQTSGPAVSLVGATTLSPSFTAPPRAPGQQVLTFSLVANDGTQSSAADTINVTIPANNPPVADAGGVQNVAGGATVTLDGSGSSDPDGDQLIYNWVQTAGPAVTLSDASSATPSFVAPPSTVAVQALQFQLTVADPFDAADTATTTVNVAANQQPIADAGMDQSVSGGDTVTLDGSGSTDPDGDALTYSWVQSSGPPVTLTGIDTVTPSFTAPAAISTVQTLTFDLIVSDGIISSMADSVVVSIAANSPPVADAGADQGPINSGDTVTLDGTASTDPDGDQLSYSWTQISGPSVTLSGANTASPTFVAPDVQGLQDVIFQLVVNDGTVDSAPDTTSVSVRGVGTITIVQRLIGEDTTVEFFSNIAALDTSIAVSGGTGQITANNVAAGQYTINASDLSSLGYALTSISCNDSDSVTNLAGRSIALALSPNENLVCTFTSTNSRDAASAAITDFLSGRNALLLSNQPDLQRRLDRLNGGQASGGSANVAGLAVPGSGSLPFAMQLNSSGARVQTSLAMGAGAFGDKDIERPLDIWADVTFADATFGSHQGRYVLGYLGVDYLVSDDVLIGGLIQIDQFNHDGSLNTAGAAEGDGWLAGPYVTARLSDNLYGDVRVAWGKSNNSVSPLGTYVDAFDTERLLFSGSLIGDVALSDHTTLWPEFSVRYLRESVSGYTDSLGIVIPGQTVDQGEIGLSPRFDHSFAAGEGWTLRPFAKFEGLLTFGTNANTVIDNGLRARIEAGIDLLSDESFRASLSGFFDGVGENTFEATGVNVRVSFQF